MCAPVVPKLTFLPSVLRLLSQLFLPQLCPARIPSSSVRNMVSSSRCAIIVRQYLLSHFQGDGGPSWNLLQLLTLQRFVRRHFPINEVLIPSLHVELKNFRATPPHCYFISFSLDLINFMLDSLTLMFTVFANFLRKKCWSWKYEGEYWAERV